MGYVRDGIIYKNRTDTGVITVAGKAGILYGFIIGGGADASVITIKNGGVGGATVMQLKVPLLTTVSETFNPGIVCNTDIYIVLDSGTTPSMTILYEQIG